MPDISEIYCLFDFLYPLKKGSLFRKSGDSKSFLRSDGFYFQALLLLFVNYLSFTLILLQNRELALNIYLYISCISFAAELIILFYVYDIKHFYVKNSYMLFKQIEGAGAKNNSKLKSTFDKWYFNGHLKPIFGFIDRYDNKLKARLKDGIQYWPFMIMFIFVWMFFALLFPNQQVDSPLVWIGRSINALVYWAIVSYALRIIISSVGIIRDYENDNWKLSVPFSRFNNIGFTFLIRAWRKTMFYFLPFWILFWLYVSTAYQHDFWLDSLYVFSALGLVGIWSIRTTVQTFLLSRKIRKKSLINYEETIVKQRNEFLDASIEMSYFRFLDLSRAVKTYREYEKMMLKDFNKASYITAVLLNIWVIFVPLLYWLYFCLPMIT